MIRRIRRRVACVSALGSAQLYRLWYGGGGVGDGKFESRRRVPFTSPPYPGYPPYRRRTFLSLPTERRLYFPFCTTSGACMASVDGSLVQSELSGWRGARMGRIIIINHDRRRVSGSAEWASSCAMAAARARLSDDRIRMSCSTRN
eukprot:2595054-Rhodomonas_salina.1